MIFTRQLNRYHPPVNSNYYDYNESISNYLDSYSHLFSRTAHLDLGCGDNPFRMFFTRNDISLVAADISQNQDQTVDYILDPSWTTLPFDTAAFASATLFDVLEHLPNPYTCMSEVSRVLAPGSTLILTVPFMYRLHEFPHDYTRFTYVGLKSLLEDNALIPLSIRPIGSPSFVIRTIASESSITFVNNSLSIKLLVFKIIRRLLMMLPEIFDTDFYQPYGFFAIAQKPASISQ